mgnify:CR=1 FL=1
MPTEHLRISFIYQQWSPKAFSVYFDQLYSFSFHFKAHFSDNLALLQFCVSFRQHAKIPIAFDSSIESFFLINLLAFWLLPNQPNFCCAPLSAHLELHESHSTMMYVYAYSTQLSLLYHPATAIAFESPLGPQYFFFSTFLSPISKI